MANQIKWDKPTITVNDLNNAVEIFPSSVIASALNIQPYPFFKAEEAAKEPINAANYFKN